MPDMPDMGSHTVRVKQFQHLGSHEDTARFAIRVADRAVLVITGTSLSYEKRPPRWFLGGLSDEQIRTLRTVRLTLLPSPKGSGEREGSQNSYEFCYDSSAC